MDPMLMQKLRAAMAMRQGGGQPQVGPPQGPPEGMGPPGGMPPPGMGPPGGAPPPMQGAMPPPPMAGPPQGAPPPPQGAPVAQAQPQEIPGVTTGQGGQRLYNGVPISEEGLNFFRKRGT